MPQGHAAETNRRTELETRDGFIKVRLERKGGLKPLAAGERKECRSQHADAHQDEESEPYVVLVLFHRLVLVGLAVEELMHASVSTVVAQGRRRVICDDRGRGRIQ